MNFSSKMRQKGELGLTLAIASLIVMMIGSIVGSRVITNNTLKSQSQARDVPQGKVPIEYCWHSCLTDNQCSRGGPDFKCLRQNTIPGGTSRSLSYVCWGESCGTEPPRATGKSCGETCKYNNDCKKKDLQLNADLECRAGKCYPVDGQNSCTRPTSAPNQPPSTPGACVGKAFQSCSESEPCCAGLTCKYDTRASPGYQCIPNDTPTPTVPTLSVTPFPTGHSFDIRTGDCRVTYTYNKDPFVHDIVFVDPRNSSRRYSLIGVNADIGIRGDGSEVDGPVGKTPIGHKIWRPAPGGRLGESLVIDWNPNRSGRRFSSDEVELYIGLRTGAGGDYGRYDYYWSSSSLIPSGLKDLLRDGQDIEVLFYYREETGIPGREQRDISVHEMRARTRACRTSTVTPTIVTPTPTVVTPTPTEVTPTPTIVTPTPTEVTPTPSLPTPTVTPTPCDANIHFLIDASGSVHDQLQGNKQKIIEAVNKYGDQHKEDQLTFTTQYFYRDLSGRTNPKSFSDFDFPVPPSLHWTNIKKALTEGVYGETFFISDGLPSVVTYSNPQKSNKSEYCVFADGQKMRTGTTDKASGCKPDDISGRSTAMDKCPLASKEICQDRTYSQAKSDSTITGKVNSIYVQGDSAYGDIDFMTRVSKTPILTINDSNETFVQRFKSIFDNACGRGTEGTGGGQASRPQSIGYSLSMQNQSSSRTIKSLSFDLCDASTGKCDNRTVEQLASPGQRLITNEAFSNVENNPIRNNNRYNLSCTVNYQGGGSDKCGGANITGNDGLQYALTLDDNGVQGTPKTYAEASDNDNNGCVNTLDYVRSLKIATESNGAGSIQPYDIIIDNKVNAQDTSVIINNLGKLCGGKK